MPIRRGQIKSCTKRFAELDHGMGTASVLVLSIFIAQEPEMADFVKVANTNEIEPGQTRLVDVKGKEIALFNVDGQFFAPDNGEHARCHPNLRSALIRPSRHRFTLNSARGSRRSARKAY